MTAPTKCPNEDCLADLTETWADGRTGSRVIGHVERWEYDGVLYWSCPDCGHRWHRFEPGDRLYVKAALYVGAVA